MLSVLVANQDSAEGESWCGSLKKAGYRVAPKCLNLSALVFILSQEKIQVVICSMNLIGKDANSVINSIKVFFPRVKIILIGVPQFNEVSGIFGNAPNVVVRKDFDADIEKYFKIPAAASADVLDPSEDLQLLLGDHFLSNEEAALILGRAQPKWKPSYAVIGVLADSGYKSVYSIVSRALLEHKRGYAVKLRDEIYVVLDNSPTEEACFGLADILCWELLTKVDVMFSIGISRCRSNAAHLYACRNEARRAASASHLFGKNNVAHISYLGDNDIEYVYPAHKERRLIEMALDGDAPGAIRMLEEIFSVFVACENISQDIVNKFALGIIVNFNIAAASKAKSFEQTTLDTKPFKRLQTSKTTDETFLILRDMVEEFAKEMDAFADIQRDALFMRLSALKAENSSLKVSDLLRTFGTTVCFLNRSVAQNTGGNIFDFIKPTH